MFDRFRVWGVGTKRQILYTEKQFTVLVERSRNSQAARRFISIFPPTII